MTNKVERFFISTMNLLKKVFISSTFLTNFTLHYDKLGFSWNPLVEQLIPNNLGLSPGLVVMGGDSCSKGHGFKSLNHILYWHFHISLLQKLCIVCLKDKNKWKRDGGWPVLNNDIARHLVAVVVFLHFRESDGVTVRFDVLSLLEPVGPLSLDAPLPELGERFPISGPFLKLNNLLISKRK